MYINLKNNDSHNKINSLFTLHKFKKFPNRYYNNLSVNIIYYVLSYQCSVYEQERIKNYVSLMYTIIISYFQLIKYKLYDVVNLQIFTNVQWYIIFKK